MSKYSTMSREELIDYLDSTWNQPDYTKDGEETWWKTVALGHAMNKVLGNDPDYEIDDSDPNEGMYAELDDYQLVDVADILESAKFSEKEYPVSLTWDELSLVKELIEDATDPSWIRDRGKAQIAQDIQRKLRGVSR